MPSNNETKGTWYESSIAESDWPQYAALDITLQVSETQVMSIVVETSLPHCRAVIYIILTLGN